MNWKVCADSTYPLLVLMARVYGLNYSSMTSAVLIPAVQKGLVRNMGELEKLINHLNESLPEGEDVSDDYLNGFKGCISSIQHYLNNQRVNGKLRADAEIRSNTPSQR